MPTVVIHLQVRAYCFISVYNALWDPDNEVYLKICGVDNSDADLKQFLGWEKKMKPMFL